MKKLLAMLVVLVSLFAVGTVSAQQIELGKGLPIGANFGRDIYSVGMQVSASNGRTGVEDSFLFDPTEGPFEQVVENRWRQLAARLDPTGAEHDVYQMDIVAGTVHGKFRARAFVEAFYLEKVNGRFVVPESVHNLRSHFRYGGLLEFPLIGISAIEMDVWFKDGSRKRFSTKDGLGDSPCQVGSVSGGFDYGSALLLSGYIVPAIRDPNIVRIDFTLFEGVNFVKLDMDGQVLSYSTNSPPAFLALAPRLTVIREGSGWLSVKLLGAEPGKLYALETTPSFSPSPEGKAAAKATVVGVGTADANGVVSWSVPISREVPMGFFTARTARAGETATVGLKKVTP